MVKIEESLDQILLKDSLETTAKLIAVRMVHSANPEKVMEHLGATIIDIAMESWTAMMLERGC